MKILVIECMDMKDVDRFYSEDITEVIEWLESYDPEPPQKLISALSKRGCDPSELEKELDFREEHENCEKEAQQKPGVFESLLMATLGKAWGGKDAAGAFREALNLGDQNGVPNICRCRAGSIDAKAVLLSEYLKPLSDIEGKKIYSIEDTVSVHY